MMLTPQILDDLNFSRPSDISFAACWPLTIWSFSSDELPNLSNFYCLGRGGKVLVDKMD